MSMIIEKVLRSGMGVIMKKLGSKAIMLTLVLAGVCMLGMQVHASETSVIQNGIYIDDIDVSGMTEEEATAAINSYVASLEETKITLNVGQDNSFDVTASELGFAWNNQDVIKDACGYGIKGNIIQRYKAKKDLEHENKVFTITFGIDQNVAETLLNDKCSDFQIEAVDATLKRENGNFVIEPGQEGHEVVVGESVKAIESYINTEWDHEACTIDLVTKVDEPKGTEDELSKVRDVIGTFTTDYHTSGSDRSANVANGCSLINGTTLYPGDSFSTYEKVSPFTQENGYHMAGSYLNGLVVESLGGGICQVSTTLYNAVLKAELQVDERYNHSMIVSYVDPSADAAISGTSKDFKFTNSSEYPIYIEGITSEKKLTFTIYGVETRDANRIVTYESEVIKKTEPQGEKIIADVGAQVGTINVQSAHIGYVAKLWKIVEENGEEVSRTEVNRSSYQMTPKTATVGIANADPAVTNAMQAAIASGSIDYVKSIIAAYLAATAVPAETVTDPAQTVTDPAANIDTTVPPTATDAGAVE